MRALEEIERVRLEKDGADLLDQLFWRIKMLGGRVDLTDAGVREAFSGVSQDEMTPEGERLHAEAVRRIAEEHGFTLSDWAPTIPKRARA